MSASFVSLAIVLLVLSATGLAQKPTIDYVAAGQPRVTGKAIPLPDPQHEVQVAVCVSEANADRPDCIAANAEALEGSANKYVNVGTSGLYAATLTRNLALGQTVTVTVTTFDSAKKPVGSPYSASATVGPTQAPPSNFTPSSPLGAAIVGLDITGASSTDPAPVVLATGLLDIPWTHQVVSSEARNDVINNTTSRLNDADIKLKALEPASCTNPKSNLNATSIQTCLNILSDYNKSYKAATVTDENTTERVNYDSNRFWVSGLLRIAGIAQPTALTGALGSPGALTPILTTAVNANPNKIVQSIEAAASFAWQFGYLEPDGGLLDVGTFKANPENPHPSTLITMSVIGTVGAVTPLSASQANPVVYYATNPVIAQYPAIVPPDTCKSSGTALPTCYVSFIPVDRSHFYRHYEAGLRFKIYGSDYNENHYRFPGTADITFGQNEYVTGGKFHGAVMHIGGSMPLPKIPSTYIFGSMDLGLVFSEKDSPQLLLTPAPSSAAITYTSPQVYAIPVSQPNRDRYRVGFGVDLLPLLFGKATPAK